MSKYFIKLIISCVFLTTGCAGKSSRDIMEERNSSSRAAPVSYSMDGFTLDYRSPEDRYRRPWDFFYKHCKLVGRNNPAPSRADWDCTEAQ